MTGHLEDGLLGSGEEDLVGRHVGADDLAGVEAADRLDGAGSDELEVDPRPAQGRCSPVVAPGLLEVGKELTEAEAQPGLALGSVHTALVLEHEHGDVPAVARGPDHPLHRDRDPVEEDLAQLGHPAGKGQGTHGESGGVGVDEEGGESPVAALGGARPHRVTRRVAR